MAPMIFAATLLQTTALTASLAPLLATMNLWYALPLVVSVSLVCAATRQEEMAAILNHAVRFAVWIVVFMGVVMGVLALLAWWAALS
jgi:hypothetical protein